MKKSISLSKVCLALASGMNVLLFVQLQVLIGCFALITTLRITEYLYLADNQQVWKPFLLLVFSGSVISVVWSGVSLLIMKNFARLSGLRPQGIWSIPPSGKGKVVLRLLEVESVVLVLGAIVAKEKLYIFDASKAWWENSQGVIFIDNIMVFSAGLLYFAILFQVNRLRLRA